MTTQTEYLQAMEIDVWQSREANEVSTIDSNNTEHPMACQSDWETLEYQVKNCTRCDLYKTRKNTVFGIGNQQTDLLFIGEAPGAREDALGEPFVGRAGLLLNEMLKSIGLNRDAIYIANILKCRPPNNRDPFSNETENCTPYLHSQIALIQPKLIIAVGRIAAQFLLNTHITIGKLRNKVHYFGTQKIPLIVTYHPAYLLRSPGEKIKAYRDLLLIQKTLNNY